MSGPRHRAGKKKPILHFWGSLDGTVRNVILSQPIETPLALIGGKVTFVHGTLDRVTTLSRIREIERSTSAEVIVISGGHADYVGLATDAVIHRLEIPAIPRPEVSLPPLSSLEKGPDARTETAGEA